MLQTAEFVANKYGITRTQMDNYALKSQLRTAAAQASGKFDGEIVPITARKAIYNKETQEISYEEVTLSEDEGNRPATMLESLKSLQPVINGGSFDSAGRYHCSWVFNFVFDTSLALSNGRVFS
jgi:acetyl-CoA C-acetyltransferase